MKNLSINQLLDIVHSDTSYIQAGDEIISRLQMVEDLKKACQDMCVERDVALVAYENLKKYKLFFESCSCLFDEGVEFMTKTEIYESIKKEVKKLEGEP